MSLNIAKVYDANVYVNNASTHGKATEVTCPDITPVMTDYNALGVIGGLKFFNGFEAMESTIKWKYADSDTLKACANFTKPVDIMVRSSKAEYDSGGELSEKSVVIYLKGYPTKHTTGGYKRGEDTEYETTLSVFYCKQEVDGEEIVELDAMNNIYKVDGEDLLAERRQNLGI